MQVCVPMCVCIFIHTCIHVCLCAYACACARVTFPCKTPPLGVLSPLVVMFVWASARFTCACVAFPTRGSPPGEPLLLERGS